MADPKTTAELHDAYTQAFRRWHGDDDRCPDGYAEIAAADDALSDAIAADATALATARRELARLTWAVWHLRDPGTLRQVTPEALQAWLVRGKWHVAHERRVRNGEVVYRTWGCAAHVASDGSSSHNVLVALHPEWGDYPVRLAHALSEIALHAGAPCEPEVLAALLPKDGPWNGTGVSRG